MKLASFGRALKHRNYRLFFSGQSVSLIGTWLTRVAMSWLVYRLTKSAFTLGLVGFAGQIPTFLLAPVAGVLIDRWNRHRVLIITQVLSMIQSALLAVLTITGKITVTDILLLSVFQGLINAFDMPTRQSFVVEMLESKEDLPNAIALNSSMVNMARLVGPSCAGILIALFGEGGCFAIDAFSYLAVIYSLVLMKFKPRVLAPPSHKNIIYQMKEGITYAINFKPVLYLLLILALISIMGMPYTVLLPVVVSEKLHGDAALLGYLMAASGLGALAGVFYLATRQSVLGLTRIVCLAAATFGVGLVGLSLSPWRILSMVSIFIAGMGMMVQLASGNTILQTIVEENKRGRVMSLYTVAVAGMVPFGSLFSGLMAKQIGAPLTILVGGVSCVLGAIAFFLGLPGLRQQIRPVYRSLGILPSEELH